MTLSWIEVAPGRHRLVNSEAQKAPARRDPKVIDLEHVSSALPRWTPLHKGAFTKDGKPIIRGLRDIKNIEAASDGRFQYDYRNDRARPFQSGDQYRTGNGRDPGRG